MSSLKPISGWIVAIALFAGLVGGSAVAAGVTMVKSVDEPGRHAFVNPDTHCFTLNSGDTTASCTFTAPSNKHLVIDEVTATAYTFSGKITDARITTVVGGATKSFYLFPQPIGTNAQVSGRNDFVVSEHMTLYADPGSTVTCSYTRDGTTGNSAMDFSVAGHLV